MIINVWMCPPGSLLRIHVGAGPHAETDGPSCPRTSRVASGLPCCKPACLQGQGPTDLLLCPPPRGRPVSGVPPLWLTAEPAAAARPLVSFNFHVPSPTASAACPPPARARQAADVADEKR